MFREHKSEKKEMGTFTPLVLGMNRSMGVDCQNFLRTLSNKISNKNNEPYAIFWQRIELSFGIIIAWMNVLEVQRPFLCSRQISEIYFILLFFIILVFTYLFILFSTIKITQALNYTKMWRGDLKKPQGLYEEAPSLQ